MRGKYAFGIYQAANRSANSPAMQVKGGKALCLAFAPQAPVAATGSRDGTMQFWSMKTGRQLALVKQHADAVVELIFSSDGKTLLTSSLDATVKIWDVDVR